MTDLSPTDRAILDFEALWWKHPAAKDQAIRDRFGMRPTAYYVRLLELMRTPEAVEYAPVVVNRLQRRLTAAGR